VKKQSPWNCNSSRRGTARPSERRERVSLRLFSPSLDKILKTEGSVNEER